MNGNEWLVLLQVGYPLVFYNGISQIFSFIDTLIAASMGASVISAISFISQIQSMFTALSSGISVGGSILVARAIGANDINRVYAMKRLLLLITIIVGGIILLVGIPLAPFILQLFKIPDELRDLGISLFRIEMLGIFCIFINSLYFTFQRASGNTGKIFLANMLILISKLILTLSFVYLFNWGPTSLSWASCISQGIIAVFVVVDLFDIFRLGTTQKQNKLNSISEGNELRTLFGLSLPVFMEKFIFSYGKAVVNTMGAAYGSMAVGALGVSNRIGGLATMPPIGFQEAEAAIISQNLGNKNYRRAFRFFAITTIINLALGMFFFILMSIFKNQIIMLFAKRNLVFAHEIDSVYTYERYATVLLALSSSVMGLLYGFGYTRISMILNLLRLFVFRIPPLWFFQHYTELGIIGLGLSMMISNILMGISSILVAIYIIYRYVKGYYREKTNT